MTDRAKEIAERIFRILAEAEAKAHGVPMEQVHFHEVGAVDSIVDVAAAAICLDDLGIEEVIVPVLYEGCGYIRCISSRCLCGHKYQCHHNGKLRGVSL